MIDELLIEDRIREYEYFLNRAEEQIKSEYGEKKKYPYISSSLLSDFLGVISTIDEQGFYILMEKKRRSLGKTFKFVKFDKEEKSVEFIEPSLDYRYEVKEEDGKFYVTLPENRKENPGEISDIIWRIYEINLALGFGLLILREGYTFRKTSPEEVSGLSENVIEIRDEIRGISYGVSPSVARDLINEFGRDVESRLHILLRPEELTPETAKKLADVEEIKKSQSRAVGFIADYLEEMEEILGME